MCIQTFVIIDKRDRLIVSDISSTLIVDTRYRVERVEILDQAGTWLVTHMALPWILKGTSMLQPGFLKPSKSSHLRGPLSDHMGM